jgi:hypothetical protein
VARKPRNISLNNFVQLLNGIRQRDFQSALTLVRLFPGRQLPDIIRLDGVGAHRTADDLVRLATILNRVSVTDLVTLANIPAAAGMSVADLCFLARGLKTRPATDLAYLATNLVELGAGEILKLIAVPGLTLLDRVHVVQNRPPAYGAALMVQFVENIAEFNLTAAQCVLAAQLALILNADAYHPVLRNVLGQALLTRQLNQVCTVMQNVPSLPRQELVTCMGRNPANLAHLVTHAVDLDAAAALLPPAMVTSLLSSNDLIQHGNDIRAVVSAGPNLRTPALFTCMARAPANYGHLVMHVVSLNAVAGILNTLQLKQALLGSDLLIANGNLVGGIVTTIQLPFAALMPVMAGGLADLTDLHTYRVDINRALNDATH